MSEEKGFPDFSKLEQRSIKNRHSLVNIKGFASPVKAGSEIGALWNSIPDILAGKALKDAVKAVSFAFNNHKPVIFATGAHLIKVGLSPLIIDLIQSGIIKGIALNGAGIIHDLEIAFHGETSEDVEKEIACGTFGLTEETASYINDAINDGVKKGEGIGSSISRLIGESNFKYKDKSILSACWEQNIPVTVHVAIGTDITHISPNADGSSIGEGSFKDFKTFIANLAELNDGGVFINVGSAVIIPEVFLKAVSAIRNLGRTFENVTTIVFDFIKQYRAEQNVVSRPIKESGKGFYIVGHHELTIPLFCALIKEEILRSP